LSRQATETVPVQGDGRRFCKDRPKVIYIVFEFTRPYRPKMLGNT